MAEFCLECWNKINDTNDTKKKFILSSELEMCEECGQFKQVIIWVRKRYIWADTLAEIVDNIKHYRDMDKR